MAVSKRDQKIVYVMGVVVICYLLWLFGIQPVYQQYEDLNSDLDKQQEQYNKNQKTLSEAKKIEDGYKRVEAQFPPDVPDKDPADVFSEEVTALVAQRIGKQPDVRPTTSEAIKGANGYEILSFPIFIRDTELKPVAEMLKAFDQRGYLVMSCIITRNSNLDKSDLQVEITLARIVKPDEPADPVKPIRPGLHIGGSVPVKAKV